MSERSNVPSAAELLRATDPDALLEGEDPTSTYLEDAVHWIRVYGELLTVKLALLERTDEVLTGATDDAKQEADVDRRLLRAEADRFRHRLDYWSGRAKQLAGSHGKPDGGADLVAGRES